MRPHKYFVCLDDHGAIFAVVKGQAAARRVTGGRRSYWAFKRQVDAEEFAAWWTYDAPLREAAWKADFDRRQTERLERLASLGVRPLL